VTALPPIENRNVRGVLTSKYPTNKTCAHPGCDKPADSVHHVFPRSLIGNGSFFVEIGEPGAAWKGPKEPPICNKETVIPHAVGLCGTGTTGHHGDLEEHRAWVKYEDGEFVWYDRTIPDGGEMGDDGWEVVPEAWISLGPLNPQPGSREGKPKRKKHKGEARRNRTTISIRVPKDEAEDGAAVYDELMGQAQEKLKTAMEVEYTPTPYITLVATLHNFITNV
jgi:hypothetical protein